MVTVLPTSVTGPPLEVSGHWLSPAAVLPVGVGVRRAALCSPSSGAAGVRYRLPGAALTPCMPLVSLLTTSGPTTVHSGTAAQTWPSATL
jgi:hypothetical protein